MRCKTVDVFVVSVPDGSDSASKLPEYPLSWGPVEMKGVGPSLLPESWAYGLKSECCPLSTERAITAFAGGQEQINDVGTYEHRHKAFGTILTKYILIFPTKTFVSGVISFTSPCSSRPLRNSPVYVFGNGVQKRPRHPGENIPYVYMTAGARPSCVSIFPE